MSRPHNKKRNAALLCEFLILSVSAGLINKNKRQSSMALKLLKKHFVPGSELYKEYRLISSLVKTKVSSEHVAASIIAEAKKASLDYDDEKLDREKSLLIRNINHKLRDSQFFDRQIKEYKIAATAQTLINNWRSGTDDLQKQAEFEDSLVTWLTRSNDVAESRELSDVPPRMNRMIIKVMTQKLNEKYGSLTPLQKEIIKLHVGSGKKNENMVRTKLASVKDDLLAASKQYVTSHPNDSYVCDKLNEFVDRLHTEKLEIVDDETVSRFLEYAKLQSELEGDE